MRVAVLYSIGVQKGIIRGLEKNGHEVVPLFHGLTTNKYLLKLLYPNHKKEIAEIEKRFNNAISTLKNNNEQQKIDAIIIFRGYRLSESSIEILKNLPGKKIQWVTDSFDRYEDQKKLALLMDKVFVADNKDAIDTNYQWLPLGFDEDLFPYSTKKDIDLLLMGDISQPHYKTRLDYIIEASKIGKRGYKVVFAGTGLNRNLINLLKSNQVEIHRYLAYTKYSKMICRSKVCVNIHQDDGGLSINPMFFAIPASGSFQITEERDYISQWLTPQRDYFPTPLHALNERIEKILSHQKMLVKNVSNEIANKHSYQSRAKQILGNLLHDAK